MNCTACQRRLLASEKPEFPEFEIEAHLAECMACREYQRQLLLVESNVPRIPLPASNAKVRLLRQILEPPVLAQPAAPVARPSILKPSPRRWSWKVKLVAGAAAAAVLVAVGISLGNWLVQTFSGSPPDLASNGDEKKRPPLDTPQKQSTKKSIQDPFKKDDKKPVVIVKTTPLVQKLLDCDLKLAATDVPRERVAALAEMADALHQETKLLAKSAPATELMKLALLYKQVVQDGMVPRARDLPMAQRQEVLQTLSLQLTQTAKEAEQLAKTAPQSAAALRTIAAVAKTADAQLRELIQEAGE